MASKSTTKPTRHKTPGNPNTILALRVSSNFRAQIKALATAEGRTESGFVRFYLSRLVEGGGL